MTDSSEEATLDLVTNDADEMNVSYNLSCTGVSVVGDPIFEDGFESPP